MIPAPGVGLTSPTTNAVFALNEMAWIDGKAYIYVKATAIVTGAGYICSVTNAGLATMSDTDVAATILQGNRIAVPLAAFAADEYGWMQVYGACSVLSEQDALANAKLASTATAGQVDDAAATGIFINGLHFQTATGGTDALNTTAFIKWATFEIQMEPET